MELEGVKEGIRVKTTNLKTTKGFLIHERYLMCRTTDVTGTVIGYVPGHGGDVWLVQHDGGNIGAYSYDEFEKLGD
jgi:hypothetical protein